MAIKYRAACKLVYAACIHLYQLKNLHASLARLFQVLAAAACFSLMKMGLSSLLLLALLFITRGHEHVVKFSHAQTTRAFSDVSDTQQELMERDIIMNLEKAQQILQKTATAKAVIENCKAQMTSAQEAMSRIETYLLQDDYTGAVLQLSHAKTVLTECNNVLEASNAHLSKALLYLTRQAMAHIEAATDLLSWLMNQKDKIKGTYNPPVDVTDVGSSRACQVDGTICQYSSCGKGKALPTCAVGFGAGVVGGANGQSYIVTSPEDDPKSPQPGTLRYGVGLGGTDTGVWITFAQDMTIHLNDMLWIRSSTTIDGRDVNVTITGRNLVLGGVTNVILHNFQINSVGESDTIHIFSGSKKVWVDHISSWDARLGLVSVLQGSTDVTISNSYLTNPNFNMLLGASDADAEDKIMRVTVYRNWFKDSTQRMPHCRWGFCHVLNNLYTNWGYYAIGARVNAKVMSESNVFIAGRRTEVTPWFQGNGAEFDTTATIQSSNDLFLNGTTFHQFLGAETESLSPSIITPQYSSPNYHPQVHPTTTLAPFIQKCSGALFGNKLEECMLVASA